MSERLHFAVLLIGMPGVGKGTQGKLLAQHSWLVHVSTGELLRSLPDDSDVGRLVANYLGRGEFVPDELMLEIWDRWLAEQMRSGRYRPGEQLLLLDGIPRNLAQCQRLAQQIDVRQVLSLSPPDDEPMVERMRQRAVLEGRSDDADETIIRHRLEIYQRETAPILGFYGPELIREIDPMQTPSAVLEQILEGLTPIRSTLGMSPPRHH